MKHGKEALPNNAHMVPLMAIKFCLDKAKISLADVSFIGYSFNFNKRSKITWPREKYLENNWGSKEAEAEFLSAPAKIQTTLKEMGFVGKIYWLDHELCHAASAYYCSPFNESAILSLDGIGEGCTAGLFYGNHHEINALENVPYPHSIGFMWEKICKFLGFSEYHACKIMGLAGYGTPLQYKKQFETIASIEQDGLFKIDNSILEFRSETFEKLENLFDLKQRTPSSELNYKHENIAASLQSRTNEIVLSLAKKIKNKTSSENLCLAGGVALNCVTNSELVNSKIFKNIFIQPAAHDAGTAVGSAYLVWNQILENKKIEGIEHFYVGPSYTELEYIEALKNAGLIFTKVLEIEQEVARLIAQGAIVGWFQGAMEFGPRALGNRSLLADPRNPNIREVLNTKVKHRELFRPFAPSVLDEYTREWFQVGELSQPNEYMLLTNLVRSDKRDKIPSVIHVDGTARIQRVRPHINSRYYKLIDEFRRITGVPVLLNTSFNDDEPIVCSPRDAIDTFLKTRIDYLVLGNLMVNRATLQSRSAATKSK